MFEAKYDFNYNATKVVFLPLIMIFIFNSPWLSYLKWLLAQMR